MILTRFLNWPFRGRQSHRAGGGPRVRLEHGHRPGLCASVLGQFHSRSFVCLLFSFFIAKELEAPCGLDPLGVGVTGTEGAGRLGPWEEKGVFRRQEGHSRGGRVPGTLRTSPPQRGPHRSSPGGWEASPEGVPSSAPTKRARGQEGRARPVSATGETPRPRGGL